MEIAHTLAVVAAAGKSSRMGAALRKPFLMLEGQPILLRAFQAVAEARSVQRVLVVCHPSDVQRADDMLKRSRAHHKLEAIVPGGDERIDSVRVGALWPVKDVEFLLIHDGARPLVTTAQVETTIQAAREHGAALMALKIFDTVKRSHDGTHVTETLDRAELYKAQTPQVFRADRYREILARAEAEGFRPTDDSALWERYVGPVAIVPGDPANLKITQPEDLDLARGVVRAREHHA